MRDTAAWSAARLVGSFVQQVTRQLDAAQDISAVVASVRLILDTFTSRTLEEPVVVSTAADPDLSQALRQHAEVIGWPMLQQCFYEDQFYTWATNMLTVAAGDWLAKDTDGTLRLLIAATFHQSPAAVALGALVGHLSAVLPKHAGSCRVTVTAVAADTAAELLADRFAAVDSTGVWELMQAADKHQGQHDHHQQHDRSASLQQQQEPPQSQILQHQQRDSLEDQRGLQEQQVATHQQQQQLQQLQHTQPQHTQPQHKLLQQLSDDQIQEVALQLASLPDRVQQLADIPQQLQPQAFVQHVLQQAVAYVAQIHARGCCTSSSSSSAGSTGPSSSSSSGSDGTPGAVVLAALLLQKFVTRGNSSRAAAAVLQLAVGAAATTAAPAVGVLSTSAATAQGGSKCLQQQQPQQQQQQLAALQQILLQLCQTHTAATEKLLVQMLRIASVNSQFPQQQQQVQQHQLQQQQLQQQQLQQRQQQLLQLLCPLFLRSPTLRTIATNKLLTHRTLPAASLELLLQLLDSCEPSLVPTAAVNLAQSWSTKDTILHLPVQQQAYITAALVRCIEKLPRDLLDPATAPIPNQQPPTANGLHSVKKSAANGLSKPDVDDVHDGSWQFYEGLEPQRVSSAVLLPAILQGVSTRLASPSPAIRVQAMRVGRVFSVKLDPSKPLFGEAGELGFMPEEIWPGAFDLGVKQIGVGLEHSAGQQQQQQHEETQVERQPNATQAAPINAAGDGMQDGGSSSSSKFAALNQLHEALASPEPDSDDDDQHTAAAAAKGGLQPQQQHIGFNTSPAVDSAAQANGKLHHTASNSNDKNNTLYDNNGSDNDDDDVSDDGSVSSLIAFDLQEDLSAEAWWGPDGLGVPDSGSLSLRGLAAAIRKQDDVDVVLSALGKIEVLIRAEPDELPVVAPELARSLLHCKIPTWASEQADHPNTSTPSEPYTPQNPAAAIGLNPNAEVQRSRALTAALSLSPLTVGDTLIAELYSPHLDQYQRMLVLDSLAAAAAEMSDARKAPRLAAAAPGQVPRLLPSVTEERRLAAVAAAGAGAAAAGTAALGAGPGDGGSGLVSTHRVESKAVTRGISGAGAGAASPRNASSSAAAGAANPSAAAAAPGMAAVSSRVWGKVSLQNQAAAAAAAAANPNANPTARTFKNRFAPVAIRWASMLLKECDVKHHGIDLFGRDSLLLGRLLTVLGSFVEAAAATPAAVPLAAGLLEVLKAKEVSGHEEVFVRRSALVAASHIVRNLPPARLAGAMIGRQQDVQDQVLVERLQWLMGWAQAVAATDSDEHCKMLAAGCCAWHVELAEGAMACLEHLPEAEGPSLAGVSGRGRGSGGGGVVVKVPKLTERLVLQ